MLANNNLTQKLIRLINFITFVDLPIRRKFLLFGIGVFFWFLVLFTVLCIALFDLQSEAAMIVQRVLPQERTVQMITSDLKKVDILALEIMRGKDLAEAMQKGENASQLLENIIAGLGKFKDLGSLRKRAGIHGLLSGTITGTLYDDKLIAEISSSAALGKKQFGEFVELRKSQLGNISKGATDNKIVQKFGEVRQTIDRAQDAASHLASEIAGLYALNTEMIGSSIRYAIASGITVLGIATLLLAIFTFWIARSIVRPVNSIIDEIHSLSTGDVDLSKRILVSTKDEIGKLSEEFNSLMESIHGVTVYKKVIEEDENLEDVYSRLGQVIHDSFGGPDYTIYEISNSKNKMKPVHPLTVNDRELFCNPEILDSCDLCKAKKTGHEVTSTSYPGICKMFTGETGIEHHCVPMIIEGSAGGVVQLRFRKAVSQSEMAEFEQKIFRARRYVRESVSVIEAKRLTGALRDSALKDPLTGLHNRRFLQEYTESLVAGVQRRGSRIGLIMCDLDYFKQINDLYGHHAGDTVLKELSRIIRNSIREADIVIRFGGEEFLIVVMDLVQDSSMMVAEKIRENVEKTRISLPHGPEISKTISLGICEFPEDTESFWQAIKFADVALYRAKEWGRNRSVRFTADMWKEAQF